MGDSGFREIETPRLRVRRFRDTDAAALAGYRSDPEVARYQAWESCTESEAADFVRSLAEVDPGTPGVWFQFAFASRSGGDLVGDCALRVTRQDPRQAELGFTLARPFQRRGLAAEGVRSVLDYAFASFELHRVFAITDERNAPAQRLLDSLGFRREARFVEGTWFKGAWATELLYAMLSREWGRRPEPTR
jgi:RimJ/RimL family protein N-acetyltransferase